MDFQQLIANGKVELSGREKFNHYLFVLVLAGLSLMGIGFMLSSKDYASFDRALNIFATLLFSQLFFILYKHGD